MVPTHGIPVKDRVGTIIRGNVKVLELISKTQPGNHWTILGECQHCKEHKIFITRLDDLVTGRVSSCGCLKRNRPRGFKYEKAIDSIGKVYPGGKVLRIVGYEYNSQAMVEVECTNCIQHTVYITRLNHLRTGITKSCGCLAAGYPGEVLPSGCTLIKSLGKKQGANFNYWLVQCWCSEHNIFEAILSNLRTGHTSSCGCNTGPTYCGYIRDNGKVVSLNSMSEVFMLWKLEDQGYHVIRPHIALWTPLHGLKGSKYTPDFYIEETNEFIEVKGSYLEERNPEGWRKQKENREWLIEHRKLKIVVIDSKEIDEEYGIPAKWG